MKKKCRRKQTAAVWGAVSSGPASVLRPPKGPSRGSPHWGCSWHTCLGVASGVWWEFIEQTPPRAQSSSPCGLGSAHTQCWEPKHFARKAEARAVGLSESSQGRQGAAARREVGPAAEGAAPVNCKGWASAVWPGPSFCSSSFLFLVLHVVSAQRTVQPHLPSGWL